MVGRIDFTEAAKRIAMLRDTTGDGKYTGKGLQRKVKQTVSVTNCKDKNGLYRFIINSFSGHGLLDTYDELGECGWNTMIRGMINHEVLEAKW